eukprot:3695279-Prorocentrum_lima.AAC.1
MELIQQRQFAIDSQAPSETITTLNCQISTLRKQEKKQQLKYTVTQEMDTQDRRLGIRQLKTAYSPS